MGELGPRVLGTAVGDVGADGPRVGGVLGVGPYSGRRQEILADWRKNINELAKCPNVYMKLGGIGMVSSEFTPRPRC